MRKMDIYSEIKKRFPELKTANHESDLYVEYSPELWKFIQENYKFKGNCSTFISQKGSSLNGCRAIEIPFAYSPFWDKKIFRGE